MPCKETQWDDVLLDDFGGQSDDDLQDLLIDTFDMIRKNIEADPSLCHEMLVKILSCDIYSSFPHLDLKGEELELDLLNKYEMSVNEFLQDIREIRASVEQAVFSSPPSDSGAEPPPSTSPEL